MSGVTKGKQPRVTDGATKIEAIDDDTSIISDNSLKQRSTSNVSEGVLTLRTDPTARWDRNTATAFVDRHKHETNFLYAILLKHWVIEELSSDNAESTGFSFKSSKSEHAAKSKHSVAQNISTACSVTTDAEPLQYSSSSESSADSNFDRDWLSKRGVEVVDWLMRTFYRHLYAFVGCEQDGEGSVSGGSQAPVAGSGTAGSAGSAQSSASRKRKASTMQHSDFRDDREGEGDEESKRPCINTPLGEDGSFRRLACPFFKRDPRRYQRERTRTGPGFHTTHRLK